MNKFTTFDVIAINAKNINPLTLEIYQDELHHIWHLDEFYVDVKGTILYGEEDNVIDVRIEHDNNNNDSIVIISMRKLAEGKINLLKEILKANDVEIKEHNNCIITKFS